MTHPRDLPQLPHFDLRIPEIPLPPDFGLLPGTLSAPMKHDDGKLAYDLVDDDADAEMVAVLTYGATKYEPGNWVGIEPRRYYAALRRHLREARAGRTLDDETTLLALAHAACDVHFLLALELRRRPELVRSQPARLAHALEVARKLRAERFAKQRAATEEIERAVGRASDRSDASTEEALDTPVVAIRWAVLSAPRHDFDKVEPALAAAGQRIVARGDAPNHSAARAAARRALKRAGRARGYLQLTEVLVGGGQRAHAPVKMTPRKNRPEAGR